VIGAELAARDALLLDVGDGIGALVLVTDEEMLGREIEVSAEGGSRIHAVVYRRGEDRCLNAAVFVELPEGRYTVLRPNGSAWTTVHIIGGRVSELCLA
jgi:hypothetical protein